MPAKRRTAKRRLDPTAELKAWSGAFQSHWTYFGELEEIGVETDPYGRPDRATAEEAWHRLGARFLAEMRDPVLGEPWALTEFGEPHAH